MPGEDSFYLEYTWQYEGFIGKFAEDSGLGDAELCRPTPVGLYSGGGPVVQGAEGRTKLVSNFLESMSSFF